LEEAAMQELAGKVAFVTGGASGIGLGMARSFTRADMKVAIADVRKDHLQAAMSEFAATNFEVEPVELDVSDRAAFAAAADAVEAKLGPVQLVCNNAGVNLFAAMDECTWDDWDWVMGVNLNGVINGVMTFAPRMKARKQGGHIVNTASMASFLSGPAAGIYTTAKFAVRGLSESLRWSLAPHGIGVSVLCPGLVASAINESDKARPEHLADTTDAVDAAFMERLAVIQKLGMDPDEVAAKVVAGILENAPYIFPHPEFKAELRELFDDILSYVPDGEADPKRLVFEDSRRQRLAEARAAFGR
jgi:NAD(P)-dependent dehydrogenase (short-subunit alcohol dehydrogenase family)